MLAGPDLLVILAIALIVFGPKKLPELAKTIGKVVGELKKTTEEVKESIGIQELERIRPHLTGVDLLVDLAEKTSEYMTPSDSDKKDTSLSKEEPVREKGLPLASASKGNGERGGVRSREA
jgi:sec-independent protein translocase protein TatB